MLKISLLGKTQFQLATDHSEPFRKSLRLSLLGYLIRTGEPVSRQRLSRIFWPHKQDSQARTYQRNVLARLKTDFSPWLVITKESVFFDVNRDCSVDLLEFEAILKRFEEMGAEEIDSHYETELRTGLELYTGPFLDGFSREVSPWF